MEATEVSRQAMNRAAIYLRSDLVNNDSWWAAWDEEREGGPDPERAALVEVVRAVHAALATGEELRMPAGEVIEQAPLTDEEVK